MLDGCVDFERDRELVELHRGDGAAFAELYGHYHRRLTRFCQRRLHTPHDADEAVQESFVRAWRAFHRFDGDRRFYPWLTVIASNVCSDIAKRRSRIIPVENLPDDPALAEPDVDAALMGSEEVEILAKAYGRLSDRQQRLLSLRETALWTSRRIAEHEGMKINAVDVTLFRARQALRREVAALADVAGGFAAVLGTGALRRAWWRTGLRLSGWWAAAAPSAATTRGPSVVTTVLMSGAAVVATGGCVAMVAQTSSPPAVSAPAVSAPAVSAPAAQTPVTPPGAPSPTSSDIQTPASPARVSPSATSSTAATPTVHHQQALTPAVSHDSLSSHAPSPARTAAFGVLDPPAAAEWVGGTTRGRPDGPRVTDPTSQATDPAHGTTDPAHQATDPAHQATDPAHGTTDPTSRTIDATYQATQTAAQPPSSRKPPAVPQAPSPSGARVTNAPASSPFTSPSSTGSPPSTQPAPAPVESVPKAPAPVRSAPAPGVRQGLPIGSSGGQSRPSGQTPARPGRAGPQRITDGR